MDLQIELAKPMPHRMGHTLSYRMKNWDWDVEYRVVVRRPAEDGGRVIDFSGTLVVVNPTDRNFMDVRIGVEGVDERLRPPHESGFIHLEATSPLSDAWLNPPRPDLIPLVFPLNLQADVKANSRTAIPFLKMEDVEAAMVHVYDSADVPAFLRNPTEYPVARVLTVANTSAAGLGRPLPPGRMRIEFADDDHAALEEVHLPYSSFPGDIVIPLGRAADLGVSRQRGAQQALGDGTMEVDYQITFFNRGAEAAVVMIDEMPPTSRNWSLIRSTHPLRMEGQRLKGGISIPPHTTEIVTYRLRIRMSGLL